MAKKGYVPVFYDWLEVTEELTAEEKGRLIDACVLYARGDEYRDRISGNERFLFPAFKQQIDRSAEISELRAKAGSTRREIPENKPLTNPNNVQQSEVKENKPQQTETKRFKAPTVQEVEAYCRERNNNVDAQRFVDFYTSLDRKSVV